MARVFTDIVWPGWEVVDKLGEGSFGGVYEIQRTLPDGTVERAALKKLTVPRDPAEIKELYAQNYDSASITEHFKEQMQELVQEYRFMQELSRNSYVVHCQDLRTVQHDDGIGWDIYIQMELLTPLKAWLSERYDERKVVRLGLNLCGALNGCHQRNIIHRDIKPENILVTDDGKFKLGDFGIAKVSEKTATGTLTGTYSYMAPEVANRQHYGASADIYSLGLVMYWMMNERTLPFLPLSKKIPSGLQRQEAQDRRFSGEEIPAPLNGSLELTRIVLKACAFNPEDRYHSVQELAEDLRNLSRNASIVVTDSDSTTVVEIKPKSHGKLTPSTQKKIKHTKPAFVAMVALIIATICLVAVTMLVSSKQTTADSTTEVALSAEKAIASTTTPSSVAPDSFTYTYVKNETGITIIGFEGELPATLTIPKEIDGFPVNGIGGWTFQGCHNLNSVVIPDGITSIGIHSFSECKNLSSISIPDSATSIDSCAFKGCSSLSSIAIPDGVTLIDESAFSGCSSLSGVSIPNSVTWIGKSAFSGCSSLSSISIPYGVTLIDESAFSGCSSLSSVSIPNSVIWIGKSAFSECSSLSSISIPDSVTQIEESTFSGCSNLTSITIPNSVLFIGSFAFSNTGLRSVILPDGLTDISENAFPDGCEILGNNVIAETNPVHEKSITVGDVIQFGSYSQSASTPEPISWIVLNRDDDKVLLLSQFALDCKPFHDRDESSTWKTSSIRKWLNDAFLSTAFSGEEKTQILNTQVITESVSTQDSVFLLSNDEVVKYLLATADRQVKPTVYAIKQGAYIDNDGHSWWWLRSSGGNYGTYKSVVNAEGKTAQGYLANAKDGTVRPAMWVNLSGVSTSEKSRTEQSTAIPVQPVYLSNVSIQHYENSMRDDAGMRALLRTYDQVVLSGDTPQIQSINQLLTQDRTNFLAEFSQDNKDYILLSPVYEPDKFFSTAESSVTYADDHFISICVETDGYAGGVRTINRYGLNYDLQTGKNADLLAVTGMNKTELAEALKNGIRKYLEENYQGKIWSMEDALSMYQVDTYPFYVKEDGEIVIPFPTYSIAAGAEGCIDVPVGLYCCS